MMCTLQLGQGSSAATAFGKLCVLSLGRFCMCVCRPFGIEFSARIDTHGTSHIVNSTGQQAKEACSPTRNARSMA